MTPHNFTDVLVESCYQAHFSAIACSRNVIFAFTFLLLVVMCIQRLRSYYQTREELLSIHVYYFLSAFQFACLIIYSVFYASSAWIHILMHCAQCIRLAQDLMLIHCYWCEANFYQPEHADFRLHFKRFTAFLCLCVFAEFVILAYFVLPLSEDCQHWRQLLLSTLDVLAVLMLVPGILQYINLAHSIEIDEASMDRWARNSKLVLAVYLVSSLLWFLFAVYLYFFSQKQEDCEILYQSSQLVYTAVYSSYMLILYVLPVVTVYGIFCPETNRRQTDENSTESSECALSYETF